MVVQDQSWSRWSQLQGFWYFARSRSREFQVNLRNPAKFTKKREIPRNSREIIPNTCRHNIFESYLGCWGCLLAVNLLNYLETSSPQRVNNIPKLPGVLRCCEKLGSNDVKTQVFLAYTVETGDEETGNWMRKPWKLKMRVRQLVFIVCLLFVKNSAFCEGLRLIRSSHLQRWRSLSERFGPRMIMPGNLKNEQSSCSFSRDNK